MVRPGLRHDLHLNAVLQTLPWPNKPSRRRSGDLLGLLPTRPRLQTEFHAIRYCWHDAVIWLIPVLPGSAYFPNAIFTIWSPHVRRKTPDNMSQVVDIQPAFQQTTTDVCVIPSLGNQMLTIFWGKPSLFSIPLVVCFNYNTWIKLVKLSLTVAFVVILLYDYILTFEEEVSIANLISRGSIQIFIFI